MVDAAQTAMRAPNVVLELWFPPKSMCTLYLQKLSIT